MTHRRRRGSCDPGPQARPHAEQRSAARAGGQQGGDPLGAAMKMSSPQRPSLVLFIAKLSLHTRAGVAGRAAGARPIQEPSLAVVCVCVCVVGGGAASATAAEPGACVRAQAGAAPPCQPGPHTSDEPPCLKLDLSRAMLEMGPMPMAPPCAACMGRGRRVGE